MSVVSFALVGLRRAFVDAPDARRRVLLLDDELRPFVFFFFFSELGKRVRPPCGSSQQLAGPDSLLVPRAKSALIDVGDGCLSHQHRTKRGAWLVPQSFGGCAVCLFVCSRALYFSICFARRLTVMCRLGLVQ